MPDCEGGFVQWGYAREDPNTCSLCGKDFGVSYYQLPGMLQTKVSPHRWNYSAYEIVQQIEEAIAWGAGINDVKHIIDSWRAEDERCGIKRIE